MFVAIDVMVIKFMKTFTHTLKYKTTAFLNVIDITDQIKGYLSGLNITAGMVCVFTKHTTTSIKINEAEDGFFKDLKKFCTKLVPAENEYHHNDLETRDKNTLCPIHEECLNGHSHILQMLIGTSSETIPVQDGKMLLGKWQRILLIELDSPREREIIVQVMGE